MTGCCYGRFHTLRGFYTACVAWRDSGSLQVVYLQQYNMATTGTPAILELHLQPGADEAILAKLGYKQEFLREFTLLEVAGLAFSFTGLLPGIASVLFYAMPNGGPVAMVWGWVIATPLILCIGLAMGELASAAPTSGGICP
ncbi:uncharacterized protein EDB91DRAFT_1351645 [Suillus paluster]|uniref:uncharacterized protein n=1 Tax=Suillus paluster TaxID=48578 RepID=UPI001B877623|nr:uncharacterized protein EDB91DRAFT_1351645 [Suillus paluster]KAG1720539.1 hypothetical protein EDB91DRAFT_1351645 [Suillus paluster]